MQVLHLVFKTHELAPSSHVLSALSRLCIDPRGDIPRTFTFNHHHAHFIPLGISGRTASGCCASPEGERSLSNVLSAWWKHCQTRHRQRGHREGFPPHAYRMSPPLHRSMVSSPSLLYPTQSEVVVTPLVLPIFRSPLL